MVDLFQGRRGYLGQRGIKHTNHKTEVKKPIIIQVMQATDLFAEHNTSHDSSARRAKTATQRDGVDNVHVGLYGKGALVMAPQHVERYSRDEVGCRVQRHFARFLALALVGDAAVERFLGRLFGAVDGNLEL